ncbi:MAG: hypothetical protein WCO02_12635 [Bacteroidota bacterium]
MRQDAGCRIQDAGCRMQDARCRMQDADCVLRLSIQPVTASNAPTANIRGCRKLMKPIM